MIGMRDHFASADVADSSAVSSMRLEICFIVVKVRTRNALVGCRQIQVFLVFILETNTVTPHTAPDVNIFSVS